MNTYVNTSGLTIINRESARGRARAAEQPSRRAITPERGPATSTVRFQMYQRTTTQTYWRGLTTRASPTHSLSPPHSTISNVPWCRTAMPCKPQQVIRLVLKFPAKAPLKFEWEFYAARTWYLSYYTWQKHVSLVQRSAPSIDTFYLELQDIPDFSEVCSLLLESFSLSSALRRRSTRLEVSELVTWSFASATLLLTP